MTQEEKAKRYDKAIGRAKKQLEGAKVFDYDNKQIAHDIRTTVLNIFPELKDRVGCEVNCTTIKEWSEEDEMIALSIEQVMNCASLLNIVPEKIDKIRTWLKSLKDRMSVTINRKGNK